MGRPVMRSELGRTSQSTLLQVTPITGVLILFCGLELDGFAMNRPGAKILVRGPWEVLTPDGQMGGMCANFIFLRFYAAMQEVNERNSKKKRNDLIQEFIILISYLKRFLRMHVELLTRWLLSSV